MIKISANLMLLVIGFLLMEVSLLAFFLEKDLVTVICAFPALYCLVQSIFSLDDEWERRKKRRTK